MGEIFSWGPPISGVRSEYKKTGKKFLTRLSVKIKHKFSDK